MYLSGDVIKFPSPHGGEVQGKIELIEESIDGSINYVINTDDGIVIRNSEDDHETELISQIDLDFS